MTETEDQYQPSEDSAVVGDLRTAALVGRNGSIDFLSDPRFDSPVTVIGLRCGLRAEVPCVVADGAARARFTLRAGQTTAFVLEAVPHTAISRPTRNGTAGGTAPSATGRRPFTTRSAVARWRAIPMASDGSALAWQPSRATSSAASWP